MAWFDSNWQYRSSLDINNGLVHGTLTDFPVFLDLSKIDNNHTFWFAVNSDGSDIRITESDGETEVAREVESIDTSNKTGEVHFLAEGDSLGTNRNNIYYIYYGNGSASAHSEGDTHGKNNVWSTPGYLLVYHGNDDASGNLDNESTSDSSFDGSLVGDATTDTSSVKVGKESVKLPSGGSNHLIDLDYSSSTRFKFWDSNGDKAFSLSAWINPDDSSSGQQKLFSKNQKNDGTNNEFFLKSDQGSLTFTLLTDESNTLSVQESSGSLSDDAWQHVVATYDGSESTSGFSIYVDGSSQDTSDNSSGTYSGIDDNFDELYVGAERNSSGSIVDQFQGHMDEIRIYNGRLSEAWAKTERHNQNSPKEFVDFGPAFIEDEQEGGGGSTGRGLSDTVISEIESDIIYPVLFLEFNFSDGPERYWTGYHDIQMRGVTFVGSGDLIEVSPIKETTEVKANNVSFTVEGIETENIDRSLRKEYQNRRCRAWLGFMDENDRLIDQPDIIYVGRQDVMEISETADGTTIKMNTENRLIQLNKSNGRRYTNEDQKMDYPDDDGLEFVADLQDKAIHFGKEAVTNDT